MKYLLAVCFIILGFGHFSSAHEGHVHSANTVQSQKGGILVSLETIHLELVQTDDTLRVYVFSKDKPPKPLQTKDYPTSAKVEYPRKKGSTEVPLSAAENYWTAKVDAKGMHRYDFFLTIEQGGHKDNVKFTVEPK